MLSAGDWARAGKGGGGEKYRAGAREKRGGRRKRRNNIKSLYFSECGFLSDWRSLGCRWYVVVLLVPAK